MTVIPFQKFDCTCYQLESGGGKFYKVSFIWLKIDNVNSFPSYRKITNVANGVNFNKTFLFFPVLNLHY